ncbi:MAG TPA: ATP-binding cassette domain-containing protein, partial [Chloroflexi bacterium]|nr:ATP-binding cassette domain-containing protein [Chloroflexota bacterium]
MQEGAGPLRVQALSRLVHDDQLGLFEQDVRHPQPAAHAPREGRHLAVGYLAQAHAPQGVVDRIDDALGRVGLSQVADRQVSTFSRGMRRRLGVADVLLKEPQLVIMDEPTQGLDPEGARAFLHTIHDLR